MHVFYTPDIQKTNELPEEEAQHCAPNALMTLKEYLPNQSDLY